MGALIRKATRCRGSSSPVDMSEGKHGTFPPEIPRERPKGADHCIDVVGQARGRAKSKSRNPWGEAAAVPTVDIPGKRHTLNPDACAALERERVDQATFPHGGEDQGRGCRNLKVLEAISWTSGTRTQTLLSEQILRKMRVMKSVWLMTQPRQTCHGRGPR